MQIFSKIEFSDLIFHCTAPHSELKTASLSFLNTHKSYSEYLKAALDVLYLINFNVGKKHIQQNIFVNL